MFCCIFVLFQHIAEQIAVLSVEFVILKLADRYYQELPFYFRIHQFLILDHKLAWVLLELKLCILLSKGMFEERIAERLAEASCLQQEEVFHFVIQDRLD